MTTSTQLLLLQCMLIVSFVFDLLAQRALRARVRLLEQRLETLEHMTAYEAAERGEALPHWPYDDDPSRLT